MQTMWSSSSSEAVSPSEFKTQIQRYAPRFVGYKYVFVIRHSTVADVSTCTVFVVTVSKIDWPPVRVLHSQQDAQEFLRFLLDGLHNEVNRVTVRPRGTVEDFDHLPWVMHLNDDDLWNCEVNPEEKECMNSVSTPDKRTTLQSCHICVVILCHRKGIFKVDEWQ